MTPKRRKVRKPRKPRALVTSKGQTILVDEADFEAADRYTWHIDFAGYPRANVGKTMVRLHTFLMRPPVGMYVDHVNHDKLDNRRENLRIATGSQNNANRSKEPRGVTLRPYGRWQAQIQVNRKNRHLGYFATEEEARAAYRVAATEAFGEFRACPKEPTK